MLSFSRKRYLHRHVQKVQVISCYVWLLVKQSEIHRLDDKLIGWWLEFLTYSAMTSDFISFSIILSFIYLLYTVFNCKWCSCFPWQISCSYAFAKYDEIAYGIMNYEFFYSFICSVKRGINMNVNMKVSYKQ